MPTLQEIIRLPHGAVWLKADLHVHTPGSADCRENITPEDIVRVAIGKGLSIIAITDHNTASWCDRVVEAARNSALTVFPGVEISTNQGHMLGIFDIDTPGSKIDDMLFKLGIPREQLGSLDAATPSGIAEACDKIEELGGVAIAAHVEGERGFLNTIKVAAERKRAYYSKNLRGLELVDASNRDTFQKGLKPDYSRKLACVQSSDSVSPGSNQHLIANIASRFSFIKMSERSISGLKLALIDPEMRIRLVDDNKPTPNRNILAMWVTGGFLNEQVFRFSDNVNCLIGDTGAGKSVALELIRFCLNHPPIVSKINAEVDRLLSEQLGDLGTVHIVIQKDDSYYLVERSWGIPPSAPVVSRLTENGQQKIEDIIDMQLFFPIKAFSQSEIIEYAREKEVRLSLTDDLIDCSQEKIKISEVKASLKGNASAFIVEKNKEFIIQSQLQGLPALYESLTQLDAVLNDTRIKQHQQWYKEKLILDNSSRQLKALGNIVESSRSSMQLIQPLTEEEIATYPNVDLLNELNSTYATWQTALKISCDSLLSNSRIVVENLASIKLRWDSRFERAETEYKNLLSEIDKDGKGLQSLSERREQIVVQIAGLETLKHQLENEILPKVLELNGIRESLLDQLQAQRVQITQKRQSKAQELTEKLNNKVRLRVHARTNKNLFRLALQRLGQRSGTKTTEYDTITEKYHPIAFVKQILSEDYNNLVTQTGIDGTRFEKLRDFIYERKLVDELYELQLTDVDDEIDVMLEVNTGIYKPIEELAHGQKCMVILMIALAEGAFPLIVDQPEDALHAPGIEIGIVSNLRSRRGIRQCIFATRNANIIVSADAEQILPLRADAVHGQLVGCGCLDSFSQKELVVYHVEGGEEAFDRRQTKYYLKPSSV
jgi:PHP domain